MTFASRAISAIVFGQQERIDLDQRRVGLFVGVIKLEHELRRLIDQLGRNAEAESELACLKTAQPDRRIDRLFENKLGRFLGDLFDVHTAGRRGHKNVAAGHAIERDAEIKFLVDRQAFFDQQRLYLVAFGAGLMRDELHSEYLGSDLLCFFGRFGELYAAAFAAAAGVDLGLNDDDVGAEFACCGLGLFRCPRDDAARNGNAVFFENCLALIFVNLHKFFCCAETKSVALAASKRKSAGF